MSKINIADAIRTSVKQYKQLAEFADELEKVGSLEQAAQEANTAVANAKQELESITALTAKAKEKLKAIITEVEVNELKSVEVVNGASVLAEDAGKKIIADAKEAAKKVTDTAQAKADKIEAEANALLATAKNEVIASADDIKVIRAKRNEAEKELAEITAKIEAARATVASFIG